MATARDILDMLRRHYLPEGRQPAGIFAPEIQAPDTASRADLIWQGVTNAAQNELVGHEIKVSRRDLLVELADPAKCDPWQRYCDRWWLVVSDPNLVDGLTLPASWGVMAPPSGRRTRSMTVLVEAPQLRPVDKAPAYATIARWLHWRHHDLTVQHRNCCDRLDRLRAENAELRGRLPLEGSAQERAAEIAEKIVRAVGGVDGASGHSTWRARVSVDDVVAALRDLRSVYQRALDVKWQVEEALHSLRHATEAISADALTDLAAAVDAIGKPRAEEAA